MEIEAKKGMFDLPPEILNPNGFICNCMFLHRKAASKYGLFIKPAFVPEQLRRKPLMVPLKSIDIHTKITNNIAKTTITQEYRNEYNMFIEAEYFFPISLKSCFVKFEAEFNEKKVTG